MGGLFFSFCGRKISVLPEVVCGADDAAGDDDDEGGRFRGLSSGRVGGVLTLTIMLLFVGWIGTVEV